MYFAFSSLPLSLHVSSFLLPSLFPHSIPSFFSSSLLLSIPPSILLSLSPSLPPSLPITLPPSLSPFLPPSLHPSLSLTSLPPSKVERCREDASKGRYLPSDYHFSASTGGKHPPSTSWAYPLTGVLDFLVPYSPSSRQSSESVSHHRTPLEDEDNGMVPLQS